MSDDPGCPNAVRHVWRRTPRFDNDKDGEAYRCIHCVTVQWLTLAQLEDVARDALPRVDALLTDLRTSLRKKKR